MTSEEIKSTCRKEIEDWIGRAYNEGYENAYKDGEKKLSRLRGECCREAGENDSKYQKGWGDFTTFYGWCNLCKRPHSGRWAHVWDYCPWCGAKINHKAPEPYPTGLMYDVEKAEP